MITDFLDEIHNDLESIIASMDSTSPVYRAFLRDVRPELVKNLLRKISTGSKVKVDGLFQPPTIECVINQRSLDWDWCRQTQLGGAWMHRTALVKLCPMWIILAGNDLRPHASQCGRAFRVYTELVAYITGTKYSVLLHELTHIYLGMGYLKPEVYDMKASMSLSGSEALRNPINLVEYVASRLLSTICIRPHRK